MQTETINTRSTANISETTTQIICFKNNYKTTIENIISSSINEDAKTTILTTNKGIKHYINKEKVNWFEVHGDGKTEHTYSNTITLMFSDGTTKTVKGTLEKVNEFGWIKTSYGYFAYHNKNLLSMQIC